MRQVPIHCRRMSRLPYLPDESRPCRNRWSTLAVVESGEWRWLSHRFRLGEFASAIGNRATEEDRTPRIVFLLRRPDRGKSRLMTCPSGPYTSERQKKADENPDKGVEERGFPPRSVNRFAVGFHGFSHNLEQAAANLVSSIRTAPTGAASAPRSAIDTALRRIRSQCLETSSRSTQGFASPGADIS